MTGKELRYKIALYTDSLIIGNDYILTNEELINSVKHTISELQKIVIEWENKHER